MALSNGRTGGQLIVDCLEAQGVNRVFSVPGESYLAVLDALYDSKIENIVARQEGGAAMMADAHGKMTGRPGVCFVTRGPGATNASAGVHIAKQDSTPMVLFVGQIGRRMRGREAFQEIDYRAMFGTVAKWVEEIDFADRIPEIINHAWHVAMSGRPGPVVLALPEDMLREVAQVSAGPRVEVADPAPMSDATRQAAAMLDAAQTPLMILGGSRWDDATYEACHAFAAERGLPVATQFRRQNLFNSDHPNYAGDIALAPNPKLRKRVEGADVVLLLGGRFSENSSQGFELFNIPKPAQKLIHVHPGAEELGRIYAPDLSINATPGAFLNSMAGQGGKTHDLGSAHQDYLDWTDLPKVPGAVQMSEVIGHLRTHAPKDAIVTNGAGNYAIWLNRFWRFLRRDGYLGPTSGSMGYSLPAAISAKLEHPDRQVICFAGDGCFQMTSQEFGTAAQAGAAIIVLVIDNGSYGTIRMHQERDYPTRVSGTEILNPDFAALARAYGGHGETVAAAGEFGPAYERAVASGKPAIVHVKVDIEALSPNLTISGLRGRS